MLQYLENFLIVASTVDIFDFHKADIEQIQDLISKKSFFYRFQEVFQCFLHSVFQDFSIRSKTVRFMKEYYLKIISLAYDLWINPFILNSLDVNTDLKTRTITNFTILIQLISVAIESIEEDELWISLENDKKLQNQQKVCKLIILNEIYMIYLEVIQSPRNQTTSSSFSAQPQQSLASSSSVQSISNNTSYKERKKKDVEKWKVEILLSCTKHNERNISIYKAQHFEYLSKRFPTFSKTIVKPIIGGCSTKRATLYFHETPLLLPEYQEFEVESFQLITVREFDEKVQLSLNGNPQALHYDIFLEKMEIELEKIHHVYIYGTIKKKHFRQFVGFAFRNEKHFHNVMRGKYLK